MKQSTSAVEEQKKELRAYYRSISRENVSIPFNPLLEHMNRFDRENPGLPALSLKAGMYEIIAEKFTPVLFRHDPFFYETGLKMAEYNGRRDLSSGGWLLLRNEHLYFDSAREDLEHYLAGGRAGLHLCYGPYCDYDHHCFPFSNILRCGLRGILERLHEGRRRQNDPDILFYDAAERGIFAVKKIAEKFAAAAREKARSAETEDERKHFDQIAKCAEKTPWLPPETFYEALACLRFFYELGSILDGIGMSVLGSPDRLLIGFYRNDLAQGRITSDEARELIRHYLVQVECKLDLERCVGEIFNYGEQGDTLILGGLDSELNDRTNELTYMFLEAHHELDLIYPKIHCRVSKKTPEELYHALARPFFAGRNVLSLLNDDVLIPALMLAGKTQEDASGYVAGGCWEVIAEGKEHNHGAHCYFSLGRVIDLSIHECAREEREMGLRFAKLDQAVSFDEVYRICMENVKTALTQMLTIIGRNAVHWPEVNPCPFFSACLDGCAESGKDYSAGGAKYRQHGVPLTGLAVFVDSLLAIENLCFSGEAVSPADLLDAVRKNWCGADALRQRALRSPHFGDGAGRSAQIARRVLQDLADFIRGFQSANGERFQCGLYSYSDIIQWASLTRATPDGRRSGDFLTQGMTPSRYRAGVVTSVLRDIAALPLRMFAANSVVTLSLSRSGMTEHLMAAFLKSWCAIEAGGMLQLNCVSREELQDAIEHPENHADLMVRLYGYSARFVRLDRVRQEEFVSRDIL